MPQGGQPTRLTRILSTPQKAKTNAFEENRLFRQAKVGSFLFVCINRNVLQRRLFVRYKPAYLHSVSHWSGGSKQLIAGGKDF